MGPPGMLGFALQRRLIAHETSWAGLARIGLWVVIFVFVLGQVLPAPTDPAPEVQRRVVSMLTPRADPRWSYGDVPGAGEQLRVAWIGGSSLDVRAADKRHLIPARVADRLGERGIATEILLYQVNGMRALDTLTMAKAALALEPDALVVTLNPFWVQNNKAVVSVGRNVLNSAPALWSDQVRGWPLMLTFAEPRHILWSLVGRRFEAIRERYLYHREWGREWFGDATAGVIEAKAAHARWSFERPYRFWAVNTFAQEDLWTEAATGIRLDKEAWQRSALLLSDTDGDTLNHWALDMMFDALAGFEAPVLVYVAPVAPAVEADARLASALGDVRQSIGEAAKEHDLTGVLVELPPGVTDGLEFADLLHVSDAGSLERYLEQELALMLDTERGRVGDE